MAALDLKDLKLFEIALEDVGDKFKDVGDEAKDASKEVEAFEKRIYALMIKANPMPRLVKDINDQLSRQADQMRQTMKAVDELARAYDRLNKAQGGLPSGLKQGPKFAPAAKAPIDKSPLEPPETPSPPPEEPRQRSKASVAGGLNRSEAEALGGSTIDAIAALAKGDEALKVLIDLGKDVAKTLLDASLEGVSLGTELKRMGVSAGALRVVDKDAKAAQAGLSLLTSVTGGLTASTVGMGEAATAAGAAEMVALTPVGLLLAGIALAVGTVATVFAVTAQQIGKSTGENLDHLKLTEEQLARVKDKGVTMGDVLSGVWKTTTDMLREAFGPALKWLGDLFGKIYQGVVDGVLWVVKSNVQAIGGLVGGFKAAFGGLGFAVGDLVISGLNIAGQAVQKLVNMAIDAINHLVRMGNSAAERMGLSIRLPELKPISIGELDNPFEGKAAAFGKDLYKGVVDGAEGAGKALDALGDRMVKNIVKARNERAIEQAGQKIKDTADAACNCGSNVQSVANDNRSYRSGGFGALSSDEQGAVAYKNPISVQEPLEARPAMAVSEPLIDTGLEAAAKAIEAVLNPLDAMVDKLTDVNTLAPELGKQFEAAFGKTGKAMGGVLTSFSAYSLEVAKLKREAAGADPSPEREERRAQAQVKAYGAMAGAAKEFFKEGADGYKAMQVAEIAFHTIETLNTIKSMGLNAAKNASEITGEVGKQAAFSATAYARTLSSLPFPLNLLAGATVLAAMAQVGVAIKGKPGGGSVPGANDMKTRQDAQSSGSVLGDSKAKSESLEKALTHAQAYENKDLEYGNAMVRSLKSIDDQIGAVASALAKSFGAGGMLSTEGLNLGKTGTSASLSNFGFGKTTTRTLQDQGIQFDATTLGAIIDGQITGSTYQQVLETTKKKMFGVTSSNKSKVITETGALDADFIDQVTGLIKALGKGVGDAADAIKATGVEEVLAAFKVDLGKLSFKDMTGTQIEEALGAIFGKLGDDMAKAAVPAIAQFQKVGEGAFETLVRVARQYEVIDTTLKSVGMTFATFGVASLEARERLVELVGGLDNLTDQTAFFAEHFLSEDERLKPVQASVKDRLTELKLPSDMTRDGFKKTVLDLNVSTEDGAKLYAALMALAPAFDKVATAAENAKAAVADKAKSIQDRIDDLVMTPAQKLAKSREAEEEAVKALDASLLPLLKSLWAVEDAAQAAADAEALAKGRSGALADLMDAQGLTEQAKKIRRDLALADVKDPVQQDYMRRTWAAQDAAEKVAAARDVLTEAYQREHDAIQATKGKFKELSTSLRAFSASLTTTIAGADLATRYRMARQTFQATASLARLGDADAMGRLQVDGEAFTAASRDYVSTSQDYLRDVGLVRSAVDEAADTADRQVSIAERQLEALDASVQGLIQINASVVSVAQAIAGLQAANQAAAAAGVVSVGGQPVPGAQTNPAPTPPLTTAQKALNNAAFWWSLTNSSVGQATANDPSDINTYAKGMAAQYSPGYMDIVNSQGIVAANALVEAGKLTYTQGGSLKFATGGGFEVGGSGPPDSKLFNLALSPGEAVNVRRADQPDDQSLINELRRLREELADLRATSARIATSNDKMERTLTNVTEGGRAMQTQAAA